MKTLHETFFAMAQKQPSHPALKIRVKKDNWQTLTYGEMAEQVRACAAALAARGVGSGDRVAILSEKPARLGHY
ncbi:MAG: AMP-binding protein [Armatimonas sp.]